MKGEFESAATSIADKGIPQKTSLLRSMAALIRLEASSPQGLCCPDALDCFLNEERFQGNNADIEPSMLVSRAFYLLRHGCDQQAETLFGAIVDSNQVKAHPKAEACYALARLMLRSFSKEEAAHWCRKALLFNPDHLNAKRVLNSLTGDKHPIAQLDVHPACPRWGKTRGTSIDRYYIEKFLAMNAHLVRGNVIEVQGNDYAYRFGGFKTNRIDVLDIDETNKNASIIMDLTSQTNNLQECCDCFIVTQTLHVIHDIETVLKNISAMLKPAGKALVTLPCVSRIDHGAGLEHDSWRFTPASATKLFNTYFKNVTLEVYGNALSGAAFFYGLSFEELSQEQLDHRDPYFPVLIGIRAEKA